MHQADTSQNLWRKPSITDDSFNAISEGFQLQYENSRGRLYQGNSFDWLDSLGDDSADMVFADPPYNIKKADWDNFESQKAYIEWSTQWIKKAKAHWIIIYLWLLGNPS